MVCVCHHNLYILPFSVSIARLVCPLSVIFLSFLEPEHEMERTYKVKQKDLVKKVDIGSATKVRIPEVLLLCNVDERTPTTHVYIHSRTWIVSTLKGRQNRYSLSEVLTIQGAFNGIA